MAMILEIVHSNGTCTRHRLGELPLTLGRGLTNDLIVEDPYVDATHARIMRDESGTFQIEDLGSVNGLVNGGGGKLQGPITLQPGAELRMGRTTLRFRDPHEPVPPALVDAAAQHVATLANGNGTVAAPMTPGAPQRTSRRVRQWFTMTPGRVLVFAGAMATFGAYTWLGSVSRSSSGEISASMMGFAFMAALWAGVWAVASRAIVQRFNFVGHLAVISAFVLVALVWTIIQDWLSFFFPDAVLASVLGFAIGFVLLAALVAAHLALSSTMTRRVQRRTGIIVAAAIFAVGMLAQLADDDEFSDVPKFSSTLKPVSAQWVPTSSVEEFDDVMAETKKDVDELAAKK
jgi:pSer/pThr/pTyr-binding forkhead associated (FHA) protein